MVGAANALVRQPEVKLAVATVSMSVKELTRLEGKSILYYLLPYGKGYYKRNHEYEPLWKKVRDEVKPDVVHIHGTEYTHGLAYVEACGSDNVCVSIQGLVSVYARYYYSGLSKSEIRRAVTFESIVKGNILSEQKGFMNRGECEKDLLKRVKHILGRTSWDRAHAWAINPAAVYHHAGETLRPEFYSGAEWSYDQCTPHSIFLSQSVYPIKGLHQVLKAMPLVLRHYPDAMIRIAGRDIIESSTLKEKLRLSEYGCIVRKMISKYELHSHIVFTGALDAEGMIKEYLKCNVFISPSSIENSPNSLGEAQVLGVPCISSYVGGTMDMISEPNHGELYRFDEIEMLAYKICEMFERSKKFDNRDMIVTALKRHNETENASQLLSTYCEIATK